MAEDPRDAYEGAVQEFEDAKRAVARVATLIGDMSNALTRWHAMVKVDPAANFGQEFAFGHLKPPFSDWPDATQLRQILDRWDAVRQKEQETFLRLSETQRLSYRRPAGHIRRAQAPN